MVTAKLVGNIWATRKSESLKGYKLMLLDIAGGADHGKRIVAVDTIDAGVGDDVIVVFGSSARRMVGNDDIPIDAAIVGIIDKDCEFEK